MVSVCDVRAAANVEVATCSATLTRKQNLRTVCLSLSQVAEGNGPVNALGKALFRALLPQFPSLDNVVLSDYKVSMHVIFFVTQVSYGIHEMLVNVTLRSVQLRFAAISLWKTGSVVYAMQLLSPSIVSGSIFFNYREDRKPCVV